MNNSEQIPRLLNYESALNHFNTVKPFKAGSKKGQKPLGYNRRYIRATIKMADDMVVCEYYGSPCVIYLPNGEIHINLCSYNTASTREFINICTGICISTKNGIPFAKVGGKFYYMEPQKALIVKDNKVLNPIKQMVLKLNRAKMKEVRARYAPFINYCSDIGKVITEIRKEDIDKASDGLDAQSPSGTPRLKVIVCTSNPPTIKEYLAEMLNKIEAAQNTNDLSVFYSRFIQLCVSSGAFSYRTNLWGTRNKEGFDATCLKLFDDILKRVHSKELFDEVEVEEGVAAYNSNAKYA